MPPAAALLSPGERSLTPTPRVVLDTNAALDWLLFGDPAACPLGRAIEAGDVVWIGTAAMQREFAHVLEGGLAAQRGCLPGSVLAAWQRLCQLQPVPGAAPWRCTDADDQPFLDLAVSSRAQWLVSRDKALLRLARRAQAIGLGIVTPVRWAML
jgi:predicted nucleic acid-binding protein